MLHMMIALIASGCTAGKESAADSAAPADLAAELTAPGPFAVGVRTGSIVYDAPDGPRTLRLVTWYPADAPGSAAPAYHRQDLSVDAAGGVTVDAAIASGAFPVAVYSHGHQGYAEVSSFLAEHLASHGWIVLAPDHTGNTTADGSSRTTEIYYQRPLDISAVIDSVTVDVGADPLLSGHVADGEILGVGHSFGGYTMLALAGGRYDPAVMDACAPDTGSFCETMTAERRALFDAGFLEPRIGAFVAMAPGDFDLFGAAGIQAIGAPMLHMTATLDQPEGSEADQLWTALQGDGGGDDRRMILADAGHQSFTDFADQLEQVPLAAADGFLPIKGYALARGRWMRGDSAVQPVIDGEILLAEWAGWSGY